jgi:Domain of unknown function (DUF4166)
MPIMGHTQVIDRETPLPRAARPARHGLRELLGNTAWERLPAAVRVRFTESELAVVYSGEFDIVRASRLGRLIAHLCRLIGTPIVPHTGRAVPAVVRVSPTPRGVEWQREYRWRNRPPSVVRSTKAITAHGTLVEELPARLCMALDVYEAQGVLHFVSRGYYFDVRLPLTSHRLKVVLPAWLAPGITHVEHRDETPGWFRFTMTVTHAVFGELFYQTGRFHD